MMRMAISAFSNRGSASSVLAHRLQFVSFLLDYSCASLFVPQSAVSTVITSMYSGRARREADGGAKTKYMV